MRCVNQAAAPAAMTTTSATTTPSFEPFFFSDARASGAAPGPGGGALDEVDGAGAGLGVDGGDGTRGEEGAPSSSSSSAARFPTATPTPPRGSRAGFWPTAISSIHDPTSTKEPASAGGLSGPVIVEVSIGFAAAPPGAALSSV